MLVVFGLAIAVPFAASACHSTLGGAPTIPTADVASVAPKGPALAPRPPRGACAPEGARPYTPPPNARTIVIPPASGTSQFDLKPFGAWEGTTTPSGVDGGMMFDVWAFGTDVFAAGGGVFLHSDDRGHTFAAHAAPVPAAPLWGTELHDLYVVAGRTVSHSSDLGKTWTIDDAFPEDAYVRASAGDGADLYAVGSHFDGRAFAWHSNDYGHAWASCSVELPRVSFTDVAIRNRDKPDSEVFMVGYDETNVPVVLRSSDCGASFLRISPPVRSVEAERPTRICFTRNGRIVLAMTHTILTSDDDGATWKKRRRFEPEILALACQGEEVLVGGTLLPLFESDDAGETFHAATPALPEDVVIRKILFAESGDTYAVGETVRKNPPSSVFFRRPAR